MEIDWGAVIGWVVPILVVFGVFVGAAKSFLKICKPNEILIFSGRRKQLADGEHVGFRVVKGGRAWRVPIMERVDRMDVTLMPIAINVRDVYSRGNIPLNLMAIANVKISTDEALVHNSIERFLGRDRKEILQVAKETLEGHLRGVVAQMTPEELNEKRLLFAEELEREARPDLNKLGLMLDTLKIQHLSDDKNYLDSIGRKQISEALRDTKVVESNCMREAEEIEADARARGGVALTNANAVIQRKENELRQLRATLDASAKSEEERAEIAPEAARAQAEQELQQVRQQLEKLRLHADVVLPAEAERQARELLAAGEAAGIAANGRAMGEAVNLVAEQWKAAGDHALAIAMVQRLEDILQRVAVQAARVKVKEVALIDSGDGKALPAYVSSYPAIVTSILDQVKETIGLDVLEAISGKSSSGGSGRARGASGGTSERPKGSRPAMGKELRPPKKSGE